MVEMASAGFGRQFVRLTIALLHHLCMDNAKLLAYWAGNSTYLPVVPAAPPGFCNRGGVRYGHGIYRGSRVRSLRVPVVLSVYQRGSLLDGLAM